MKIDLENLVKNGFVESDLPYCGWKYELDEFVITFNFYRILHNETEIKDINQLKEVFKKETGKDLIIK